MKYILRFLSLFLIMNSVSSCKSYKDSVKLEKDDIRFTFRKGACFGKCPIYKLEVSQDGLATFYGEANTPKLGKYEKKLNKEEFNSLVQKFQKSEFENFDDKYKSQIADLPMIKIGYNNGDGIKEVAGKENRPDELMQLQFALEKIVDSNNWTLLESIQEIDMNKEPDVIIIYDEVIIEPVPGLKMPKWLDAKKNLGVRILKKIAPDLNMFLITYNQKLIAPDDFLKLLQEDKGIKNASFNKKVQTR